MYVCESIWNIAHGFYCIFYPTEERKLYITWRKICDYKCDQENWCGDNTTKTYLTYLYTQSKSLKEIYNMAWKQVPISFINDQKRYFQKKMGANENGLCWVRYTNTVAYVGIRVGVNAKHARAAKLERHMKLFGTISPTRTCCWHYNTYPLSKQQVYYAIKCLGKK